MTIENQTATDLALSNQSIQQFGLVKSLKAADLLVAKPIALQVSEQGEENVKKLVSIWIMKCYSRLDIDYTNSIHKIAILAEDLVEMYPTDSLEDIREALKKGGQGVYPFGHEKRGSLTMQTVNPWITSHLDEKAETRAATMQSANTARETHILDVDEERLQSEGEAYFKEHCENIRTFYTKGKEYVKKQNEIRKKHEQGPVVQRRKDEQYAQFKESPDYQKNRDEQNYIAWKEELKKHSIPELEEIRQLNKKDAKLVSLIDEEIKTKKGL